MKKIAILVLTLLVYNGCSVKKQSLNSALSYNHKPYIKLKYKRVLKRLKDE